MISRLTLWWIKGLLVLFGGLCWFFYVSTAPHEPPVGKAPWAHLQPSQAGDLPTHPSIADAAGAGAGAGKVSNAGSTLPGSWGVFKQGSLQPHSGLKERFDHFLDADGDASLTDMRLSIKTQAIQDLGHEGGQAVLGLWDVYVDFLVREELAQNTAASGADAPEKWMAMRQEFLKQAKGQMQPDWYVVLFAEEQAQIQHIAEGLAMQMKMNQTFQTPP